MPKRNNNPANAPELEGLPKEILLELKIRFLKEKTMALLSELQELSRWFNHSQKPDSISILNIKNDFSFYEAVRKFEIDLIIYGLKQTGGNQTQAARLLGINLTTLNSKIKQYEISMENHLAQTDGEVTPINSVRGSSKVAS